MADGAPLVEVLPAQEYEREHIAGAIRIPLGRLVEEAGRLPRAHPVIVYCYDYQ
jgi:rhodanese-related sulfurtransferase